MKEERAPRTPMSTGAKIAICVVCGVVAFCSVLAGLMITRGNLGFIEAKNDVSEILNGRAAIEAGLDMGIENLDLSEEDEQKVKDFETALEKTNDYMQSLEASSALEKDENLKKTYSEAKARFDILQKVLKVEQGVMMLVDDANDEDGRISAETLAELKQSENEFLRNYAADFEEYLKVVEDFKTNFADKKGDKSKVDEAYGRVLQAGEKLQKKYAEISFDDIFGMSRSEMMTFYDSIKTLSDILEQKL